MKPQNILSLSLLAALFLSCHSNTNSNANSSAPDSVRFKGQNLNILCWEGYADETFTQGFEKKYGVKVQGTYYGSDDELVSKLSNGGDASYDIVSPSSDVASYLIDGDLVQPVDTSKISNWNDLAPQLRNLKDVRRGNNVYGLPFCWGPDYLVYNADKIKQAPDSWNIFWDTKYKGRVSLWDDISNIYLVAQMEGLDKTDQSVLYNLSDAQLNSIKQKLIDLKPQIRKYWATAGELNDMFKNGEVDLAVGWPLTPAALNAQGMNIKAVIPKEGATGWIDRLMITKNTPNKELASLWLDYVSQPENMALVAKVTNYCVSNPLAAKDMDPALRKSVSDNNDLYLKTLNFWQYVKNRKQYNEVWNEVKSAQ